MIFRTQLSTHGRFPCWRKSSSCIPCHPRVGHGRHPHIDQHSIYFNLFVMLTTCIFHSRAELAYSTLRPKSTMGSLTQLSSFYTVYYHSAVAALPESTACRTVVTELRTPPLVCNFPGFSVPHASCTGEGSEILVKLST